MQRKGGPPAASRSAVVNQRGSSEADFAIECSSSPDGMRVLLTLSSFELEVRDAPSLQSISVLNAHSDRITCAVQSVQQAEVFWSSSADGTVKSWDVRAGGSPVGTIQFESEVFALAVNHDENLLVTGVENNIMFFDRRMVSGACNPRSMLGMYSDVHSNEIIQLSFHPYHPQLLASSGEDGLLCLYNIAAPASTEAVVSIMNSDCAVSRFGFFGPRGDGLYCISCVETLSLWHHPSAQRLCLFEDVREQTGVDYLIGCIEVGTEEELLLFGGSHSGEVDVLGVRPTGVSHRGIRLQPAQCTVRSLCPWRVDGSAGVLFAAEDGSLSAYSSLEPVQHQQQPQNQSHAAAASDHSQSRVGAQRRPKDGHKMRFSPY